MRQFGLIGYPLDHSFSKKYFQEKFTKENINNCSYNLFPLKNINQFPLFIEENKNIVGLNVTMPYKESIILFLSELDDVAKQVGAVNTIKIVNKKLYGYNTDVYGFEESIKPYLNGKIKKALIFGTGGAAKAVSYVLSKIGVDYFFVSRTKRNNKCIAYDTLNKELLSKYFLLVNTTPVGTISLTEESLAINYESITKDHIVYDLTYNPTLTLLMKSAHARGATILNGLNMLYLQAERSWEIWNNSSV